VSLIPDLERQIRDAAAHRRRRSRRRAVGSVATAAAAACLLLVVLLAAGGESGNGGDPAPSGRPSVPEDEHRGGDDPGRAPPSIPFRDPLPGSESEPLEFTFAGVRYTATGFRNRNNTICTTLASEVTDRDPMGCLGDRLLRAALAQSPARLGGGGGDRPSVGFGFSRADVVRLAVDRSRSRVVLSEPWRPEPWRGEPIRFFYLLVDARIDARPGTGRSLLDVPIEARLRDGRVVELVP
jgi:hypothetical protein